MNDIGKNASLEVMYEERLRGLQVKMQEESLEYLFVPVSVNLRYATGLALGKTERLTSLIVPQDGDPMIVCPSFELAKFQKQIALKNVEFMPWDENVDPYSMIKTWFEGRGTRSRITIGVDSHAWYCEVDGLAKVMPNAMYVDANEIFGALRLFKSSTEIEYIETAISIIDKVRDYLFDEFFKEGVHQVEGRARLCYEAMKRGGLDPIWWGVYFGKNTSSAHGGTEDIAIQEGTVIMVDSGVEYEGYRSDITRTTTYGTPPEGFADIFEIVREAQKRAIEAIKPGVTAESIDRVARNVIEKAGYGENFTHRLGHGLGMEEHEPPWIGPGQTTILKQGMVFTVEPGIYLPGKFGIRLEENVVVTGDSCNVLSIPVQGFEPLVT